MRDAVTHVRRGKGFIRTIRMNGQPVRHDIRSEGTDRGGGSVRLAYAFIFHDRYFKRERRLRYFKGEDDDDDGGEKSRKTLRAAPKAGCGPVARPTRFQRVYPAGIDNAASETVLHDRAVRAIRLICGVPPINRCRVTCLFRLFSYRSTIFHRAVGTMILLVSHSSRVFPFKSRGGSCA